MNPFPSQAETHSIITAIVVAVSSIFSGQNADLATFPGPLFSHLSSGCFNTLAETMASPTLADQAGQAERQPADSSRNLTERQFLDPTSRHSPKEQEAQNEKRATRAKKACITCRRRHLKCDATRPLCLKCTTRGSGLCEGYEPSVPTGEPRALGGEEKTPQNARSSVEKPADRAVILQLAEMASLDPNLRKLMQQVADGKAQTQELDHFQRIIDNVQGDLEFRKRNGQQGHSPTKDMQQPAPGMLPRCSGPNYDAASLASRVTGTSNHSINDHLLSRDNETRTITSDNALIFEELEGSYSQSLPTPAKQEAPFTDSGYASGIDVSSLPGRELGGANTPGYDGNDLDARTIYSAASSVAMDQAQRYISELSSTIHGKLSGSIDVDHWMSMSKRLLSLIKDFSIKLGLESSVQVNRDIMHFVHKRSREIATQLDSMVLCVNASAEDADKSIEAKRDHMLLSDKMALWNSKATEVGTYVNENELFVGVTDEEDTIDTPELSKYNKTVIESKSFKWLIDSLRRELALRRDFDESEGFNHRESLRRKITENLPTGKISKSQPPTTHSVTFRVPGWALLDAAGLNLFRSESPLHEAIVITICSRDAQAASLEDYMKQTWPSTWRTIFNLVYWASVGVSGIVYADILHDKTKVSASSEDGTLIVNLHGTAHTIAECGEQLAWLQTSCAHAPPHQSMGNVLQRIPVIMSIATFHVLGRVCFDIGVGKPVLDEFSLLEQSQWIELLKNHNVVLIPGYPILRRPKAFNGIEVSPHHLLDFLGRDSRSTSKVSVDGTRKKLSLVKQVQNVYLWHETPIARKLSCVCSKPSNQAHKGAHGGRTIDLENILSGRHIIEQCRESRPHAGSTTMEARTPAPLAHW
ncbi:Ammonium transporter 1 [Colletotrichum scovillei]|uniref:Ammonium transporter 1 n=1 Tax=Colletotrichum scovillei TaxID=1209932 RepID=A0A9P7QYS3_9PEZI|nr:Ammonium transporter 1 [Colletotrichum scovillei]KAG7065100.1 Ammonium transporter 1 [Colletotrichum scovillei]